MRAQRWEQCWAPGLSTLDTSLFNVSGGAAAPSSETYASFEPYLVEQSSVAAPVASARRFAGAAATEGQRGSLLLRVERGEV